MRVEYSHNNSGGRWWLSDDDWKALEAAGWKIRWYRDQTDRFFKPDADGRSLGALAHRADRDGLSLEDAVAEWEQVTGQCSTDAGCPCCGQPHDFTLYDDSGEYVRSGPDGDYSVSW